MNLHSTLLRNAAEHPDKTAIVYFRTPISYGELSTMIRRYASVLYHQMGLRACDIVTVSLPTTPESIAITYALNMIGVTACNVDVRFTAEQMSKIVSRTHSKALFIMDFNIKAIASKAKDLEVERIVVLRGNESFPKVIIWSKIWDFLNGRRRHVRSDKRFAYWCDITKQSDLAEVPAYEWPADSPQLIFQTSGT
ncbi:MAG: AMP-binding protein, partial [Bacteroidales bacterium]|nr:AMP-binding protein [Bacteroidales bacterium]